MTKASVETGAVTNSDPSNHSLEWWEGYACQAPRSRNPYQGEPKTADKSAEWLAGWLTRFFGESP